MAVVTLVAVMIVVTVVAIVTIVAVMAVVAVMTVIQMCRLPWDHIVQIALWIASCDRIMRIASRSTQLSMRLRCTDKRCNVRTEGSIAQNGSLPSRLCVVCFATKKRDRDRTLYRELTVPYVNSRDSSVESPNERDSTLDQEPTFPYVN